VIDLTYDNSVDTADMFRIQVDNAGLRFTDSPIFDVGKTVEIHMGYAGDLHPMMLGEISAVSPSFPAGGAPTLSVTGYDKSHHMRHTYTDRSFKFMNKSAIVAQVAAENGLIPIVDPLPIPRESLKQIESDWALLKRLAAPYHFDVYVRWDKLYFQAPRPQTEAVTLEWGKSLASFSPRLSTSDQAGIQVIRGYDAELAQAIVASIPVLALDADLDTIVERLGSNFVERLARMGRKVIHDQQPTNFFDATLIAKSVLKSMLEGLYEGSGSCIGMPKLRAGDQIEIRGVGKRFSGRYRLSKVTHTINGGGYQTQFEVSQRYNVNLLGSMRDKIAERPSPNGKPPIQGVLVGNVTRSGDPGPPGQVEIQIPALSDYPLPHWAYVATPMAGPGAGMYFLPASGDTVLVAFEHGDVNRPYVVGSLWQGEDLPPEAKPLPGQRKVIKTKSGLEVVFDETQGKERLVLRNQKGSSIIMDAVSGEITIEAKGNLELKSKEGDINLTAANVKVKVTGAMDVS
jgi:phage protein D